MHIEEIEIKQHTSILICPVHKAYPLPVLITCAHSIIRCLMHAYHCISAVSQQFSHLVK